MGPLHAFVASIPIPVGRDRRGGTLGTMSPTPLQGWIHLGLSAEEGLPLSRASRSRMGAIAKNLDNILTACPGNGSSQERRPLAIILGSDPIEKIGTAMEPAQKSIAIPYVRNELFADFFGCCSTRFEDESLSSWVCRLVNVAKSVHIRPIDIWPDTRFVLPKA